MIDCEADGLPQRQLSWLDFDMIKTWGELSGEQKEQALAILRQLSISEADHVPSFSGTAKLSEASS